MSIDLDNLRRTGGIIKLQGKEFITFSGLLVTAHSNGLQSITPTLINYDAQTRSAVFSATAIGERGSYTAHGDADEGNVKRGMQGAILRMAETRAVCRALRMYLGIGMTAREELPGDAKPPSQKLTWTADQRSYFVASIRELGVALLDVGAFVGKTNLSSPAEWSEDARHRFLADLSTGGIPDLLTRESGAHSDTP
jgi:hypothetical protein